MLDSLTYTDVEGSRHDHSITIFSLSTCGFCKRCMTWLGNKGFAYRFIHVDHIPVDVKTEAKKILKERFKEDVAFPFAIIDDDQHLVGFIEPDWVKTLGL